MRARRAGTKPPICARSPISATWRISVDLPAMLGPVTIMSCSPLGIEADVVGDERARRRQPLDDRVAAVG